MFVFSFCNSFFIWLSLCFFYLFRFVISHLSLYPRCYFLHLVLLLTVNFVVISLVSSICKCLICSNRKKKEAGIPDDIADDKLEDAVTSMMEYVDVIIQNGNIEACHRIGKSDKNYCSIC